MAVTSELKWNMNSLHNLQKVDMKNQTVYSASSGRCEKGYSNVKM